MATENTDFLKFSAYSIKDLITRKLSEDTRFTDLVYEGSNLAVLIDIFSYIAQCLLYQLNNAAAESMWSDTLIYENISRLCRFIGYSPRGYVPATILVNFPTSYLNSESYEGNSKWSLLPYSYVKTNKYDANGKEICFSTVDVVELDKSRQNTKIMLYNGRWKKYSRTFESDGTENLSFTLTGLKSDSDDNKYVAWPFVHVFIETYENGKKILTKWETVTNGMFLKSTEASLSIYDANSTIYELSLTEDKTYKILFGNNIHGKIPPITSTIHVYYLEANPDIDVGTIGLSEIDSEFKFFNFPDDVDECNFFKFNNTYTGDIAVTNISTTTKGLPEETVEQIRNNAPLYNKIGNRLITKLDYLQYIKMLNADNIIDCLALNNYEYISTFYKWLYRLGVENHNQSNYYINESRLVKYDYKYADAADLNNVYLWIKMRNLMDIYFETLNNLLYNLKPLTTLLVYLYPIEVKFAICAANLDVAKTYFLNMDYFDLNDESYIEVTVENNSLYSTALIRSIVETKIINFFNEENFTLGGEIKIGELLNDIYSVNGIINVKTVYKEASNEVTAKTIAKQGLNFACWSTSVVDTGDDMFYVNSNVTLECFLFPSLQLNKNGKLNIKIIKHTTSLIETTATY